MPVSLNGLIEWDAHYDNLLTVAHAGPRSRTPDYFPPLKHPSSSGFYAVGDMDMVLVKAQIYGNIYMLLLPRQLSMISLSFSEIEIPLLT
jgi:hypothetical protein